MPRKVLSDQDLIFFAELIGILYTGIACSRTNKFIDCRTVYPVGGIFFSCQLEQSLGEHLRELLQEALRDSSFRNAFYTHFSNHDMKEIHDIAWPWMQEQLTFES
jgi:hypothetical protein